MSIRPGLLLPIALIIVGEAMIYTRNYQLAVAIHAINLIYLALASAFVEDRAYQALMMMPLFRLLNIAMPVFFQLTLYSYALIYAPMMLPMYLILRDRRFTNDEIGIKFSRLDFWIPIAIAMGLLIGWGEYQVIKPQMLTPDESLRSLLLLAAVQIFFVGLVEEFMFRSTLQTVAEQRFGSLPGLLLASILFGIMHSGYGLFSELIYVSLGGVAFGLLFQWSRSLPVISLAHGVTNVSLFMIVPGASWALLPAIGICGAIMGAAFLRDRHAGEPSGIGLNALNLKNKARRFLGKDDSLQRTDD